MLKRITAILLVLALSICIFVGCDKTPDDTKPTEPQDTTPLEHDGLQYGFHFANVFMIPYRSHMKAQLIDSHTATLSNRDMTVLLLSDKNDAMWSNIDTAVKEFTEKDIFKEKVKENSNILEKVDVSELKIYIQDSAATTGGDKNLSYKMNLVTLRNSDTRQEVYVYCMETLDGEQIAIILMANNKNGNTMVEEYRQWFIYRIGIGDSISDPIKPDNDNSETTQPEQSTPTESITPTGPDGTAPAEPDATETNTETSENE